MGEGAAALLLTGALNALRFDDDALARRLVREAALVLDGLTAGNLDRGGLSPWQARRIREHIRNHLGGRLRLTEVCALINMSNGHFSRLFRLSFGLPFSQYLIRRRVERAQILMLTTDKALCEIAILCGLADQAHLTRLFTRHVGASPKVWRRMWEGTAIETAAPDLDWFDHPTLARTV